MSSSRLGFLSCLVIVVLSSACSSAEGPGLESAGTGPDDGKFVAPPTKPEDGQKSSTPEGNTPKSDVPASKPPPAATPDAGAAGSCGTPQCTGIAGFCGCRGGSEGKQTIMACSGGKCRCNDQTFDDNDACGAKPDANGLKALFAACGCQ